MGGSPGGPLGAGFDPAMLFAPQAMAGGGLPEGVSMSTPDPYQGFGGQPDIGAPQGLEPWNYQVPNPKLPKPAGPHVNFENFPGGGGTGRRGNRRARRRRRFFDEFSSGSPPRPFWDRSPPRNR